MTALYIILAAVLYAAACLFVYALLRVSSDADDRAERDFDIFANARTCYTCAHHLGGGQCRQNLESECGEGEFEAWEPRK
jgi:hypothetical protein